MLRLDITNLHLLVDETISVLWSSALCKFPPIFVNFSSLKSFSLCVPLCCKLGCTDAAPRPAHPRPTRRDVVTWEGRRRPHVRAASCHVASPESGRRGWNRADSVRIGRIGLYRPKRSSQAKIQKKKKKKVQTHRLTNLNTQTPLRPSHFVQNSQTPSLTPSLIFLLCVLRPSSLFSVFWALCECCVHTALLQPSGVLSLLFSWIFILFFFTISLFQIA